MSELNDDNKFDLEIRSMLEDVEEAVPEHLWAAIEDRLDGMDAAKRVPFVVWMKRAGIASAAAAILLTLFLTGTFSRKTDYGEDRIAVIEDVMTPSVQSEENLWQDISGIIAEIPKTTVPETTVSKTTSKAETTVPETTASETDNSGSVTGKQYEETFQESSPVLEEIVKEKYIAEAYTDPFAFDEEKRTRKPQASITLSGNAISNSKSEKAINLSKPVMMSQRGKQTGKIQETSDSNYGIPVSVGVGAKIKFTPRWALGIGVNYSLLSRSFSGIYKGVETAPVSYPQIRNLQSYIGIPVNAYFSIIQNNIVDFYAYAGGTAEKCIVNKYLLGDNQKFENKVSGFQFSANAGIGVEFIVADIFGIYIDPSLRYYFPDSRQPKSIRTNQPLTFGFEVGFRVRL